MKKIVAIVDAYSAGNQYAELFRKRGFDCVHVASTPEIPFVYQGSFKPQDFSQTFQSDCVDELRRLGVSVVIAGTECGVNLADELSEALGLVTNGTKLSLARRDKYLMAQAIAAKGVRIIPQLASSSLEEILAWKKENDIHPMVLKPSASAGTDHVFVCHTPEEIVTAFEAIQGKPNLLGVMNHVVLAQQLITGTEYVVNMVSCRGKRRLTELWRYTKISQNGGSFVYDRDDLLAPYGKIQDSLVAYTEKVLDALEIQHGPSHAEVYMTADGPVLMEVGARMDGVCRGAHTKICTGENPFETVLDAYLEPEKFLAEKTDRYELKKVACTVSMISHDEGIITAMPGLDALRNLPSLSLLGMKVREGERLSKTVDMVTIPGLIHLVHEDASVIEADYLKIRDIERTLFAIAPEEIPVLHPLLSAAL